MAIQEVGSGDTRKKPIKLGGALVTLVEPHRGHEVDYNRWYERDHYYSGCIIGAWTIAGTRFVATSDCKEKRYPANSSFAPDTSAGSYLAFPDIRLDSRTQSDTTIKQSKSIFKLKYGLR